MERHRALVRIEEGPFVAVCTRLMSEHSHELLDRVEAQLLMPTGQLPAVLRAALVLLRSRTATDWYVLDCNVVLAGPYPTQAEAETQREGHDPNTSYVYPLVENDPRYKWPPWRRKPQPSPDAVVLPSASMDGQASDVIYTGSAQPVIHGFQAGRFVLECLVNEQWGYSTSWDTWQEATIAFDEARMPSGFRLTDQETGRVWGPGTACEWEAAAT